MDEISSSQIGSQLHFSKIGIPSSTIINADDYYKKMYDYTELIKKGTNLLLINNYSGALEVYNMALSLANELNNDYKINETSCNIGIVYFYLGKLNESIKNIQPCYNYINSVCRSEIGKNTIRNLYLLCKSGANLSMCKLAINSENNNCLSLINNIIDILSKEDNLYNKKYCIQYLNIILFRVNTLLTKKNYYS